MNHYSQKGFASVVALFLASFLLSLGGFGTALGLQQNFPEKFKDELNKVLGKAHYDELSPTVLAADSESSGNTGVNATGATGITGTSGATGISGVNGATGDLGTISAPPNMSHLSGQNGDDENETEIDDETSLHASGSTGLQLSVTGQIKVKHEDD